MPGVPELLVTFLARWNAHDVEGVVALYAADAVMTDPTLSEPIHGRQALQGYYAEMWSTIDDARLECRAAESSPSAIAWLWRFSGAEQDARWEVVGASHFTVRGGEISRDRAVWEPLGTT